MTETSPLTDFDLLDSPPEPAFDRVTGLVADLLEVPVALLSIIDDRGDRQFFKSLHGLPEPWATHRQTPLSHSFCKQVRETNTILRVDDARTDDRVADNPAVGEMNVLAYLGVPIQDQHGLTLGALCAISDMPRTWRGRDEGVLITLSHWIHDLIRIRSLERQNEAAFELLTQEQTRRILAERAVDALRLSRNQG